MTGRNNKTPEEMFESELWGLIERHQAWLKPISITVMAQILRQAASIIAPLTKMPADPSRAPTGRDTRFDDRD